MSQLVRDLRFALRSMAKSPGVSLLMIGTLAVAILYGAWRFRNRERAG